MSKDRLFNIWCWGNWTATCIKMKLDHFLTLHRKIDSKWTKDVNVRKESIKILEENTGNNIFNLNHSNFFLESSSKGRKSKAKTNYWNFIKTKSFCTAKETVNKTKRPLTEWEKILANNISDKGVGSKIYKELRKLNTQRTNNPIKKWQRT